MGNTVYVIPTKNGLWRVVQMPESRYKKWKIAWDNWWKRKGHKLAISPEMWLEESRVQNG